MLCALGHGVCVCMCVCTHACLHMCMLLPNYASLLYSISCHLQSNIGLPITFYMVRECSE